jgi:hypothetical protein
VQNRLSRGLIIPLFALALLGMPGQAREVLEEEHPAAVTTCGAALAQRQCHRTASDEHQPTDVFAAPVKRIDFSLDRRALVIAPHGRPDNTRGDPMAH